MGRGVPKRLVTFLGGVVVSSIIQLVRVRGWFEMVEDGCDEEPEFASMFEPAYKELVCFFGKGIMVEVSEKSRKGI